MSITSPTFVPGAVLDAEDLDAAYLILVNEINRLGALPHNANLFGRNLLNNGDFSVWQRAVTQTTSGYGSDDRWNNEHNGSTKVASQQTFTVGQTDVANNPTYYARTVVTSAAAAGNYVRKTQRIEGVQKTSGETVTLTFAATQAAGNNISVEFVQNFGTGGSPSTEVTGLGITTLSLGSSWVDQTVTVTLPSITGKTLGTAGDDYLEVIIWCEAGSDFDARTNSLGQQSGTYDIANIQLEIGATATDFEYVQPADQRTRCQRYYQASDGEERDHVYAHYNTTARYAWIPFRTEMRAAPTVTQTANFMFEDAINISATITTDTATSTKKTGYGSEISNSNTANQGGAALGYIEWTASAEL